MVTTFPAQLALTPAGKPFAPDTPLLDMPVAPVVANVIFVIALLIQTVWLVPAAIVFAGVTVIVPVEIAGGQPPVVVTV